MAGKPDTWMPLYIGDYLRDTMRLPMAAHGGYLLLLMHAWNDGPLPDDDGELAVIARATPAEWKRVAHLIRRYFVAQDGVLIQPRLERERARAVEKTQQRSEAGKASAAQRAAQRNGNDRSTTVDAPLQQNPIPSPSPLPSEARPPSVEEAPPSAPPAIAPPPASPNARGCRLPDDFEPDLGFASRLGLEGAAEWAKFRDYWAAQPGLRGRKTDWQATWRNWCRKAAEQRPRASGLSEKPRFRNGFAELLYDEAMARAPSDPDPFIDADPIPKDLLQ